MHKDTLHKTLIATTAFIAVSGIGGGIGLIADNGLGMPLSNLATSPFHSYLIPGLILLIVFGGTQALAALLLLKRHENANLAAAVAGFGALIWIFTEIYTTHIIHWLQIAYFVLGMVELTLVLLIIGTFPRPQNIKS